MNFYQVAELKELSVNVQLDGFRFFARLFKLNQQRPTPRQPEQPIRVTGLAFSPELNAFNAEVLQHLGTSILFDLIFDFEHQRKNRLYQGPGPSTFRLSSNLTACSA